MVSPTIYGRSGPHALPAERPKLPSVTRRPKRPSTSHTGTKSNRSKGVGTQVDTFAQPKTVVNSISKITGVHPRQVGNYMHRLKGVQEKREMEKSRLYACMEEVAEFDPVENESKLRQIAFDDRMALLEAQMAADAAKIRLATFTRRRSTASSCPKKPC